MTIAHVDRLDLKLLHSGNEPAPSSLVFKTGQVW
jgi:hypothetical protein